MSEGVQFDEDSFSYGRPQAPRVNSAPGAPQPYNRQMPVNSDQSGMGGWLMRHGIAKSPTFAQAILVIVVIINIIITIVMVKFFL